MVGENRDRAKTYKNSMEQIPNGAAGLYLLGMIYERKAQTQQAEECYELALKEDPTLWTAYEKLVTFKAKQPLQKHFPDNYDNLSPAMHNHKFGLKSELSPQDALKKLKTPAPKPS